MGGLVRPPTLIILILWFQFKIAFPIARNGATLKAFVKEMAKYNTKIVGAVFVSKVFNPPKPGLWTWLRIALHKENGANKLKRP